MQKDRNRYRWHDMPCYYDPNAKAMNDQIVERIINATVLHCAKGISQDYKLKEDIQKSIRRIIPKHHITVSMNKQRAISNPGISRRLSSYRYQKQQYQDVSLYFHPIVYTDGYGLFQYVFNITGCPDNLHPGTGNPIS